ncbi:phosphatase PAP2 family protein [Brachybacterium sp. FME24]|uniref:phosphatase PAP2 family protein n=1 Tax=Brachybacterium sp. FME24 TaxID=2742605 RepID=UPI001D033FA1|nr:phosphatase PAP2 family protein [Brachybacterium sp. FME24]
MTSVRALTIGLLILILLVAGPLQELDYFLARRWLYHLEPDLMWFAQNVLNRVASQAVCLLVLAVVAVVLARRRRSWRPIVFALASEAAFLVGIGGMKVLLARGVTYERDPDLLDGGLWAMGMKGISFPSGHAAEAVLIYGAAVYLIAHYSGASRRLVRLLCWGVVVISVNSVVVSFLLGWHWASDLVGGLLAGGLLLRILMRWDERGHGVRRADL